MCCYADLCRRRFIWAKNEQKQTRVKSGHASGPSGNSACDQILEFHHLVHIVVTGIWSDSSLSESVAGNGWFLCRYFLFSISLFSRTIPSWTTTILEPRFRTTNRKKNRNIPCGEWWYVKEKCACSVRPNEIFKNIHHHFIVIHKVYKCGSGFPSALSKRI